MLSISFYFTFVTIYIFPYSFSELKNILSLELNLQSDACARKASEFTSFDDALQRIKTYVQNDVNEPLIVHGPPGSGKSCLLSKAATFCMDWVPNVIVVFRIVGISLESSTEERISMSICQQCATLCLPDKQLLRPMVNYLSLEKIFSHNIIFNYYAYVRCTPFLFISTALQLLHES